uniref:Uncharacterized protein n=1 Tax=Arundo donax TaxID=35708 RepID=A0A0A8XZP6_ARUDO
MAFLVRIDRLQQLLILFEPGRCIADRHKWIPAPPTLPPGESQHTGSAEPASTPSFPDSVDWWGGTFAGSHAAASSAHAAAIWKSKIVKQRKLSLHLQPHIHTTGIVYSY